MPYMTPKTSRRTAASFMGAAFAFCLTCSSAWADDVTATSRVTAATIFPDRAIVTRVAKLHVAKGAHTVVLSDVPAGLDESSLRVQAHAGEAIQIGTVETKRVFLTEAANAAQRDKQAQIQAKQDEKALLDAQIQALQNRKSFIEKISEAGAEKTDPNGITKLDFAPEKWTQAWGLIQTGMDETLKALAEKNIAERKLNEDIEKLTEEFSQIMTTQAKERRDIHINLESAGDTDLELSLNYQTQGASWAPVYDARLDTSSGALSVEQYGQASQQTGEDWTDADLTLSTTIPSRGSEMPQLGEWPVQLVQQFDRAASYAAAAMKEAPGGPASPYFLSQEKKADADRERNALATGGSAIPTPVGQNAGLDEMGGYDRPRKDPLIELKGEIGHQNQQIAMLRQQQMQRDVLMSQPQSATAATVQSSEYAAEFRVPGHVNLKSTADATKLRIGTVPMTASLTSRATPRLTTQAYLFAKAINNEKFPLLPGRVAKYRDDAFIGNAMLPLLRPGETVQLAFGVDDRVKVSYRRTHDERSNPTFAMLGDSSIERQYETKIQNLHKEPIDVMVFEQYPVAGDPDVKAELESNVTTGGYGKDPDNRQGIIVWSEKLKPQEEKTYILGFEVKFPKDRQLTGL